MFPAEGTVSVKLGGRGRRQREHRSFEKEKQVQDHKRLETDGKSDERPGWAGSLRASEIVICF